MTEMCKHGLQRRSPKSKHAIKDQRTYDWLRQTYVFDELEEAIRAFTRGWTSQLSFMFQNVLERRSSRSGYISDKTGDNRRQILFLAFRQLREDGIYLRYVTHLKGRHIAHLLQRWDREGLANGTIQERISHLRFFARLIHKAGMIHSKAKIAANGIAPSRVNREAVTKVDKSWSGKTVDIATLLHKADQHHVRLGLILRGIAGFGLRVKEAVCLLPHEADKDNDSRPAKDQVLRIVHGTKGGRPRTVPINTPELRALVDEMKRVVQPDDSLSGKSRSLEAACKWYYRQMRKLGITKDQLGVTSHGLRHEYVHQRLAERGVTAPVKAATADESNQGGSPIKSRKEVMEVRRQVSNMVGHSRPSIITAYSGSFVRPPSPATEVGPIPTQPPHPESRNLTSVGIHTD